MTDRQPLDPSLVRRMVAGHRAAAIRGRCPDAAPCEPTEALRRALALWALNPALFFAAKDPVRLREEAEARAAWMLLRAKHSAGPAA